MAAAKGRLVAGDDSSDEHDYTSGNNEVDRIMKIVGWEVAFSSRLHVVVSNYFYRLLLT